MEIEDYPDYLIYEDGRVWSKYGKGKFLKANLNINNGGYLLVSLYKDGKEKKNESSSIVG